MTETPDFSTIRYELAGGIARIRLDRAKVLNAIDPQMLRELNQALDLVESDPDAHVAVISGEGRAFCAGFDLKASAARGPMGPADWREVLEEDLGLILRFWDCRKPTIAAVHGYCLGGGFEIALACDLTVAADSALMGEPEVRFGSGIVAMLLPWITGPKQAKEILLTGQDRLPAARALDLGIVNRVVPAEDLEQAALSLAQEIVAAAPAAVRMTKQAINRSYEIMGMRQALMQAMEIDIFIESSGGPERETFNRIRREEGLKAAIAWRESRRTK
jgi:enoyl-CoA hydratase